MATKVIKRDGQVVFCDGQKISNAIVKAAMAVGETINGDAIANDVLLKILSCPDPAISVETIQDMVEQALIHMNAASIAKAYILYRENRRKVREGKILIDSTSKLFNDYLNDKDWLIKENANTRKSINGMNNYIRESFTRCYWLNDMYPERIRQAHLSGDFHIHDLGFFGPYCCGWDLQQLLTIGFGGISGKVSSLPAKHLRSFL